MIITTPELFIMSPKPRITLYKSLSFFPGRENRPELPEVDPPPCSCRPPLGAAAGAVGVALEGVLAEVVLEGLLDPLAPVPLT